jgi:hypothetical protein
LSKFPSTNNFLNGWKLRKKSRIKR